MNSINWKDIANRAIWTFAQAAAGVLVVAGTTGLNADILKGAGIAGVAAVISFVKNYGKEIKVAKETSE